MSEKKIWAFVKDPGGTNVVLATIKGLEDRVRLFSNGKASEILTPKGIAHEPITSFANIVGEKPELILTSMCSDGGVGRDAVKFGKEYGIKTVAIQDAWGARLKVEFRDPVYWPDHLIVPDQAAKGIVLDTWKGYLEEQVLVSGWVAFDPLAALSCDAERNHLFDRFGLQEVRPVVFFAGQHHTERTADNLRELISVMNDLGGPVYFVPRWHARVKKDAPQEHERCLREMEEFRSGQVIDTNDIPYEEYPIYRIVAASDVVVGMWSTDLLQAAYLNREVITMLYPDISMPLWQRSGIAEYPLVTMGCAAKATSRESLKQNLAMAFRRSLGCGSEQKKHFPRDGKSAERASAEILRIWDS